MAALLDDAQFQNAQASLESVFSNTVTRFMTEDVDAEAFVAQDAPALVEGLKGLKAAVQHHAAVAIAQAGAPPAARRAAAPANTINAAATSQNYRRRLAKFILM